ncbi:MAG: S1 RNA-binding domain-containing protein, partial [Elusimicrobia bacterium]|nr:S1 RNA-binding domain-containing protein [Elusimicrobiota bacterium]
RHSSVRERLAQETEWDILDLKKAQYMKERLGETFSAIISSVTSFGFFVELTEVQVEGLVHVESLKDDAYTFDETRLTLYGRRTHKSFRPGQSVTVLLANVNETKRQLDFQLVRKKQL